MKLSLNNLTLIIDFENEEEKKLIKKYITYKDNSNCFYKGKFHKEKAVDVCLGKEIKGKFVCFSGLTKEILLFSKGNNIKVTEFIDNRDHFDFQNKDYTHEELKEYFPKDFDYVEHQIRALQAMIKTNNGLIVAATSSGKSQIIKSYLHFTNLPTLILIDKATLGAQLSEDIRKDGLDCGFCYGKGVTKGYHMVSTIQSVKKITDFTKFKCLIIDECFPGNTKVLTETGLKKISHLVKNKSQEKVWTFNQKTKKTELKQIYNWFEKKTEYDYQIVTYLGKDKITSTPNHKFYVIKDENYNLEEKIAEQLQIGDKLIVFIDNNNFSYKEVTKIKTIKPKCKTVYNISVEENHNYFVGKKEKVLVSNCHKASSNTYQEFLKQLSCPLKFGFTASPYNGDYLKYATIRQFLGYPLVKIGAQELMENKVMAKAKIFLVKNVCEETFDYPTAYDINITHGKRRNEKIANIANSYEDGVAILVRTIEHGEELIKLIPDAVFLKGETPLKERMEVIKKFNNGEIKRIIGSSILNEGISISNMKVLIMASSGKAISQTIQKIGRVLRITKEKTEGIFYDFIDIDNRFLEKQSKDRLRLYKKEGFNDYKILDDL